MISKKQYLVFGRLVYECLLLNLCLLLVLGVKTPEVLANLPANLEQLFLIGFLFNLCWLIVVLWNNQPDLHLSGSFRERINQIILEGFLFVGLLSTLAVLFKIDYFNRTTLFVPIVLFSIGNLLLLKPVLDFLKRRKAGSQHQYQVLLVGNGNNVNKIVEYAAKNAPLGYNLVGVVGEQFLDGETGGTVLGKLEDLESILSHQQVDEIFINLPSQREGDIRTAIKTADLFGVRVNLVPETPIYVGENYRSYSLANNQPVFQLRKSPLDRFSHFFLKRTFDIVFSFLVLVLLAPVFLIIALLVYLDGKGPLLYKPLRKGESNNTFKCYKFRTMSVCDDPVNGTRSTEKNDSRITKVGKILRKYDLDELPQFFNVFKGEMSVVGPRPHRTHLQRDFRRIVDDYMVRHYVKPGITGWAQVNGWRGPTQSLVQKRERINHDLWYIENWSFWLDLKIIVLTVFGRKCRSNVF